MSIEIEKLTRQDCVRAVGRKRYPDTTHIGSVDLGLLQSLYPAFSDCGVLPYNVFAGNDQLTGRNMLMVRPDVVFGVPKDPDLSRLIIRPGTDSLCINHGDLLLVTDDLRGRIDLAQVNMRNEYEREDFFVDVELLSPHAHLQRQHNMIVDVLHNLDKERIKRVEGQSKYAMER